MAAQPGQRSATVTVTDLPWSEGDGVSIVMYGTMDAILTGRGERLTAHRVVVRVHTVIPTGFAVRRHRLASSRGSSLRVVVEEGVRDGGNVVGVGVGDTTRAKAGSVEGTWKCDA